MVDMQQMMNNTAKSEVGINLLVYYMGGGLLINYRFEIWVSHGAL